MSVTDDVAVDEGAGHDGRGRVVLRFSPMGVETRVPPGVNLFDAASWNAVPIDSTCGGHGTCKKCKVRVLEGDTPISSLDIRAFSPSELRDGWRLACRAVATTDLSVEVPPMVTRPKAATVGVGRQVILRPSLQKRYLEMEEPTLEDQASDLERVLREIDDLDVRVSLDVLRDLGTTLRKADFKVTAVISDDELIAVEPGDTTATRHGMAFDLGTTTVVATLLDLSTGTPVAVASMLNMQQPFGADVITRISATMLDPDALGRLRDRAQETLAQLAREVCEKGEIEPEAVYEVAIAGNATMTQLVLGMDPEPLGVAPFIMSTRSFPALRAADLGLALHPRATAYLFPALGAYVGGDIVAGILATGMTRDKRIRLFIDVGTNCEIVLGSAERVLTTAAPAGPAFEAAQIKCGMRAAAGAIETIRIDNGELKVGVIGDVDAVGLCGSGLVDACAELAREGFIDESGRFLTDEAARALEPVARRSPRAARRGARLRARLEGRARRCRRLRLPLPARRARAAVRQGRDRDRLEDPRSTSSASRSPTSRRCCSPAASARTSPPRARCASASCPSCPSRASSPPATWRARARRWCCSRPRSARRRWPCSRRSSTSSCRAARTSRTCSSTC